MVFQHNHNVISINSILIKDLYLKTFDRVAKANDAACGYSNLLNKVPKLEKTKPVLAQKILFLINDAINDTHSFVQDSNSADRIILEAIKTDSLKLLNKRLFDPIRLPTESMRAVFDVLERYGKDTRENLYHRNAYGIGAVYFENVIRWIAEFANRYLIDMNILDRNFKLSFWRMVFVDDIPDSHDIFYNCTSGDKLYGFFMLYDIWRISRKPYTMTFDTLLKFVLIEIYLEGKDFDSPIDDLDANLVRSPTFKEKMAVATHPKITVEPAYVSTLEHLKPLDTKIWAFARKIDNDTNKV